MRGGSESDNENRGLRVAESRHRPAPILPVAIRPPLVARHVFAITHQPRAQAALRDTALEQSEFSRLAFQIN